MTLSCELDCYYSVFIAVKLQIEINDQVTSKWNGCGSLAHALQLLKSWRLDSINLELFCALVLGCISSVSLIHIASANVGVSTRCRFIFSPCTVVRI